MNGINEKIKLMIERAGFSVSEIEAIPEKKNQGHGKTVREKNPIGND